MSDKEKVEKENEQFSSSILYVATAVYVGVCAMVFGALYAKMPTFGEAFLELMKNYGTILAGIPVLVAVVVAKQQLDANRRQHAATIKRSFKSEIDVLKSLRRLVGHRNDRGIEWFSSLYRLVKKYKKSVDKRQKKLMRPVRNKLPDHIIRGSKSIWKNIAEFGDDFEDEAPDQETLASRYKSIQELMESLEKDIDAYEKDISQYWS